jgi:hypothetical protein
MVGPTTGYSLIETYKWIREEDRSRDWRFTKKLSSLPWQPFIYKPHVFVWRNALLKTLERRAREESLLTWRKDFEEERAPQFKKLN